MSAACWQRCSGWSSALFMTSLVICSSLKAYWMSSTNSSAPSGTRSSCASAAQWKPPKGRDKLLGARQHAVDVIANSLNNRQPPSHHPQLPRTDLGRRAGIRASCAMASAAPSGRRACEAAEQLAWSGTLLDEAGASACKSCACHCWKTAQRPGAARRLPRGRHPPPAAGPGRLPACCASQATAGGRQAQTQPARKPAGRHAR